MIQHRYLKKAVVKGPCSAPIPHPTSLDCLLPLCASSTLSTSEMNSSTPSSLWKKQTKRRRYNSAWKIQWWRGTYLNYLTRRPSSHMWNLSCFREECKNRPSIALAWALVKQKAIHKYVFMYAGLKIYSNDFFLADLYVEIQHNYCQAISSPARWKTGPVTVPLGSKKDWASLLIFLQKNKLCGLVFS